MQAETPSAVLENTAGHGRSYMALSLRRLVRKKLAMVFLGIIVLMYGSGILAAVVTPYDYNAQDLTKAKQGPSLAHPFGTDRLGRDQLTRVIYGLRTTVIITITSLIGGSLVMGRRVGVNQRVHGQTGRRDNHADGGGDVGFPGDIPAAHPAGHRAARVVGWVQNFEDSTGIDWIIRLGFVDFALVSFALSIFSWFGMARLVRGQVLQVRENQYSEAARAVGASTSRILRMHVFPNIISPVIVSVSAGLAGFAGAELF